RSQPFLRPGDNRLCVMVMRWSAGSWLEDQDMWRLRRVRSQPFLRPGDNRLCVMVMRWSAGSWLEDQDMWR
ncbi:hypothetical protein CKJ90_32825, partial [Klebsiella pneumoniae]